MSSGVAEKDRKPVDTSSAAILRVTFAFAWLDPLVPCGLGGVVESAHLVSWSSVVRGN